MTKHPKSLNRSLLTNSAFLIGNTIAGSCFGFLFWLVAARSYTQAQVGLGAAYISALNLLTTFGELGLGTALIRFAPTLGAKRDSFVNSALAATAICTLGLTFLFSLGIPLWSPELGELARPSLLALFAVATVAFALGQLLDSLFVAFQSAAFSFARNLAANVIRLALVLTVGRFFGAAGLLLAVGAAALATSALALLALAPRAVPGYRARPAFNWRLLRARLGYTLGNHFAALLWSMPTLVYPLIIIALLGAGANAQFYISWMVANILLIVPAAVSTSTFARAANHADVSDRTFWRTMWRTMAALVPLAAMVALGAPLMLRVFGKDYSASGGPLFLCLVASSFPYTINTFTIVYHRVHQHIRGVIWVAGAVTLLCLALSIGLGLVAGLVGIGAGWLAGQTLGMLIALWSRRRRPGADGSAFDDQTRRRSMHITTVLRRSAGRPIWLLWGYLLLITAAEIVTSAVHPQLGMVIHAALLVGMTLHGAIGQLTEGRRLTLALTLAPLIRLLSLALPLTRFPQVAWYPLVAIPLLIAAWMIVKLLGMSRRELGLRAGNLPLQLMLIGGGLGLGAIEYFILQPAPLVGTYAWRAVLLPALSLVIFTGFTEEVIFRGLLQAVAAPVLGRWTLVYVALLFAVLHIGYLSVSDVVFVFAVGLLFGQIVRWGGSILGVTLAHGLTNVTLFLIMPYVTANPSSQIAAAAPWAIWGGTAVAIIGVDLVMLRSVVRGAAPRPGVPAPSSIRVLRRDQGLTYSDLGQQTGIPARLLAEIEHGLRMAQPEQLGRIAQALGVEPQSLARGAVV